jgi:hypothetical protein
LEDIGHIDSLPHVYNSRYFDLLFPEEIGLAKSGEYLLAFVMSDERYFK